MSKPWTMRELNELAKMNPKIFARNPELAAYVQEEDLRLHPWKADPDWEAKDAKRVADAQEKLVRIMLRKGQLLKEYEERFGRPYYG